MEPIAILCVATPPSGTGRPRRERGPVRRSTQSSSLNAALMKGLARVIAARRLTSPLMRALLEQPATSDGHLRDEMAAIRQHDGDAMTWDRLLVFSDALGQDAGLLVIANYPRGLAS